MCYSPVESFCRISLEESIACRPFSLDKLLQYVIIYPESQKYFLNKDMYFNCLFRFVCLEYSIPWIYPTAKNRNPNQTKETKTMRKYIPYEKSGSSIPVPTYCGEDFKVGRHLYRAEYDIETKPALVDCPICGEEGNGLSFQITELRIFALKSGKEIESDSPSFRKVGEAIWNIDFQESIAEGDPLVRCMKCVKLSQEVDDWLESEDVFER